MLKPAGLYENELKRLFAEISFDDEYIYFDSSSWRDDWNAPKDSWSKHEFASVDDEGNVVGYLAYNIDRDALTTSSLRIVNFRKNGLGRTFGQDLRKLFEDIFLRFQFRKLNFGVVVGNPAEAFYDKYVEKMGGRIQGYREDDVKLMDGNYYDMKLYEVMRDKFVAAHKKTTD